MADKKKLNYTPALLFSQEEVAQLRAVYGGQDNPNMDLLRKIFLPSLLDPSVPVEYGANDMWTDKDWATIPVDEIKSIVVARQDLIKHVAGSIMRVRQLANQPEEESAAERVEREKKNSNR